MLVVSGVITLRHNNRLHHIGIGCRHDSTRVLNTDGELLRELQLDPTRDYQLQPRP